MTWHCNWKNKPSVSFQIDGYVFFSKTNLYLVQLIEQPFPNPKFLQQFFCLLLEYFYKLKVLNWYHNAPNNVNLTALYIKKIKTLCNTLNWWNWNWLFDELNEIIHNGVFRKSAISEFVLDLSLLSQIPCVTYVVITHLCIQQLCRLDNIFK